MVADLALYMESNAAMFDSHQVESRMKACNAHAHALRQSCFAESTKAAQRSEIDAPCTNTST